MNELMALVMEKGMDDCEAMNLLQGAGVVSDECVFLSDVAEADCGRAVEWLRRQE
jgi:hypothetical protein